MSSAPPDIAMASPIERRTVLHGDDNSESSSSGSEQPDYEEAMTAAQSAEEDFHSAQGEEGGVQGPIAADIQETPDELWNRVLKELPPDYKEKWGDIGFTKQGRVYVPVLVISPFDVRKELNTAKQIEWKADFEQVS